MSQHLESWIGWVGTCTRCGQPWLVFTNVLYTDGKRSGWGTGHESSRDPTTCVNMECLREKPYGRVQPLLTLEEQEPYRAAYALGGEVAVWHMLGGSTTRSGQRRSENRDRLYRDD